MTPTRHQREMVGCTPSPKRELDAVRADAATWDSTDQPPVADYASFRDWLAGEISGGPRWWEFPCVNELFVHNQGQLGSCAGFAMANARMMVLIMQVQMASEQYADCINPFVTWCKSKGGSTIGGQTMAAIAQFGNRTGSYPVSVAGEYSDRLRWESRWDEPDAIVAAASRQIGISEIVYDTPEKLADEIYFLCKHRRAVFFGATKYVETDGRVLSCGGHAQAYGGYDESTDRIGYVNSWGDIYTGMEPVKFGMLINREQLVKMCTYSFDAYAVTYAEEPYDLTVEPTLEV